jgi:serine/threonine-protein kinase
MSLSIGDKLGPYEVLGPLGAGGMGEVYRAVDTQLDREVAVKVLPHSMASDPERLARFDREAKILAALNHPNIAVIHGLEKFDGGRALVMELVPGDTLGSRLKRGAMPVEEACKVATQIADALEAAHDKGVVHRDLKPGNVMITPAGLVKVLDFGMAAMASPVTQAAVSDNSPTVTMGMTMAGAILGTAAYMSPEQASGLAVDKRSDIWSYGVVLWEMVSGKRLFGGATISHTLADVLRAPIDVEALAVPAPLKKLIRRCLDREIRTRLRDIGEARVAIGEYLADAKSGAGIIPSSPEKTVAVVPRQSRLAWGVAVAALAGVAFVGWRQWSTPTTPDRPLTRFSVDLGPDAERDSRISAILSPDGTRIVFTGRADGGLRQLYTRRLDQPAATLLSASANTDLQPFFSPDGKWVGYWSYDNKIMKVPAQGGVAVALGASHGGALGVIGASWGDDDNIIIGSMNGLWRIPASGGEARIVNKLGGHCHFPQVLPGAKAVVFSTDRGTGNLEDSDIDVLPFDGGEKKTLLRGGYWPRYLATSGQTGHLIYMHEGKLFGAGFDPRSLELLGAPTVLLDDVAAGTAVNQGGGQFAFSQTGTFVYLSGKAETASFPISWLDASGKVSPLVSQAGLYGAPRLSPNGKLLAYFASGSKGYDLWVYDVDRGTPTQLTFSGGAWNTQIAWARDSKHLVYGDGSAMWWIRADGAGQRQALLEKAENPRPFSFAPDGRLAFTVAFAELPDIWALPIDMADPDHPKPGKGASFLADPAVVEVDPAFSPDGKFLAYVTSESIGEQVFVQSFPGPGGKWKISTAGGKFPAWSRATHEILFLGGDDRIMAVNYTIQGDSFSAEKPRAWSPTQVRRINVQQNFDVAPDGKHVVVFPRSAAAESPGSLHATFLLNFFEEVRRRVPTGK